MNLLINFINKPWFYRRMIKKTAYYSWKIGSLSKGCQLCVKGEKLVLFITGLCSKQCLYCPISDLKKDKDVVYANEMPTRNIKNIIKEAKLCSAKGAGITGGDPLCKLWRTCFNIRSLKKAFGKKFHIHLYTPLNLVDQKKLRQLYNAGLDEIRFHPDISDDRLWKKIRLAKQFDWSVGVEIPSIPGKLQQTKKLIDFIAPNIEFLNINELEISDSNANHLVDQGFRTKDRISYGVKGSQEIALKLLKYCEKKGINVHYCTTTLKDRVQLAERIKKRAQGIAKLFDRIMVGGTLIRGAVYPEDLAPGFGYNESIRNLKTGKRKKCLVQLGELKKLLKLKSKDCLIDEHKPRLLMSVKMVKKLASKIKEKQFKAAIIHEYPTYDELELEVEFL